MHGGRRFTEPVLVDDEVIAALRTLSPLAPLHNPANLEGIVRAQAAFPGIPQVAVFDTAFHHTLPPQAYTYAVPRAWRDEQHVRRYGFHGTSYAWVSRRTAQLLDRAGGRADGRAPPRQRRQRVRHRRRTQRGDLDGAVARRGPGDGHPLR